jgi:DMSO/TMAO reductase YedYZ heme-binding membrane subunit
MHYLWLVKDIREPLRYAFVVALLLILRIPHIRKTVSSFRYKLRSSVSKTGVAS